MKDKSQQRPQLVIWIGWLYALIAIMICMVIDRILGWRGGFFGSDLWFCICLGLPMCIIAYPLLKIILYDLRKHSRDRRERNKGTP